MPRDSAVAKLGAALHRQHVLINVQASNEATIEHKILSALREIAQRSLLTPLLVIHGASLTEKGACLVYSSGSH